MQTDITSKGLRNSEEERGEPEVQVPTNPKLQVTGASPTSPSGTTTISRGKLQCGVAGVLPEGWGGNGGQVYVLRFFST